MLTAHVPKASTEKLCAHLADEGIMLVHSALFEGAGDDRVRFGVGRADFADSVAYLDTVIDHAICVSR